jgi:hypothetical protein
MKITDKDWIRMSDLVLSGKGGEGTAKIIKNKDKAIARFVAGLKLDGVNLNYNENWKEFCGSFSEFGNKAIELGATIEEIQGTFGENEVPQKYKEKLALLGDRTKKLSDRFVGDLTRRILAAGFDINYLPHNGYAITFVGKDAMERNGRKWTIGYKAEISKGSKKVELIFDAITDEGDGPTSYFVATGESTSIFNNLRGYEPVGKNKFIANVMENLEK